MNQFLNDVPLKADFFGDVNELFGWMQPKEM
jgi:hypothetical protein